MAKPRLLPILLVTAVAAGGAACSAASTENPAPAGTPATAPGAGTPKPPPSGDPVTPAPVDPTNDPSAKACTGKPGEIYALSAKKLTFGDDVPLCRFEGSVMMIVNVASFCGNTPQYAPLQALYAKYQAQGFYVLGFPSPQFGDQEYANEKDVTAFCTSEYKITFPMFAIGNVNPPDQQPVYTWLKSQPGQSADVNWNFEKFLISRHGQVVKRVADSTQPDDPEVVAAIEAELAKP